MKKKMQRSKVVVVALFLVLVFGVLLSVAGLSQSIAGINGAVISKTPEAILASAGVNEGSNITLPVAYYDQKADPCVNMYDQGARKKLAERQFEWTSCGYKNRQIEQGLVDYNLGADYLPVARSGKLFSNLGVSQMERWFNAVEGKSKGYSGTINLQYRVAGGAEFSFASEEFYPLDEANFSAEDAVNSDGHNHLFTMNFAMPFVTMASGDENFEIIADDDTFVFLGDRLVLDMGGIHEATSGRFVIDENGEVYSGILDEELAYSGITLAKNKDSIVRIFHADRDAAESVFKMTISGMNLNVVQAELANAENGVQVAYDPTDPSYVAPLGQSVVVRPDGTKGYIIMATIEGVLIVVLSVFAVMMVRLLVKRKV